MFDERTKVTGTYYGASLRHCSLRVQREQVDDSKALNTVLLEKAYIMKCKYEQWALSQLAL